MSKAHSFYSRVFSNSDRIMALMLLSLHALLVLGDAYHLYSALFLCHYGFFLLWQPVMRQSNRLSWQAAFIITAGAGLAIFYINWWMVAFWIAGLFALIGGRVFANDSSKDRIPKVLAASYLLAILLLWVVPRLLTVDADLSATDFLVVYALPILPIIILFLSSKSKPKSQTPNIDFFYTLLIFLLTLITILGSFAIGEIWKVNYISLLMIVVFSLAGTLVAISWLWNPSATFSGLELLMSRYLLTLGLPFEQWINKIAHLFSSEDSADQFLRSAINEFNTFDWVSGLSWDTGNSKGEMGEITSFTANFDFHQLQIKLYSRWQLNPAMYLHVQLLTQILGEFYEAKRREEIANQNTYMQSLYETGSRLTHDIKNILQSLGTLSSATQQLKDHDDETKLIALIKKQLPLLNQRLASTLNKLEQPSVKKTHLLQIASWWKNINQINMHNEVIFEAPDTLSKNYIDADVLDSIVDNLAQNALEKAKLETNVKIKVTLFNLPNFCLEVSDTGSAIPLETAERLFKSHINSNAGLGVGLYHAAQQAKQAGYELSLIENRHGAVRFRLEKN